MDNIKVSLIYMSHYESKMCCEHVVSLSRTAIHIQFRSELTVLTLDLVIIDFFMWLMHLGSPELIRLRSLCPWARCECKTDDVN